MTHLISDMRWMRAAGWSACDVVAAVAMALHVADVAPSDGKVAFGGRRLAYGSPSASSKAASIPVHSDARAMASRTWWMYVGSHRYRRGMAAVSSMPWHGRPHDIDDDGLSWDASHTPASTTPA
jgi:hypothetical protein